MNRPNSGWKTGSVSSSLQYVSIWKSSALRKHLYLETVCKSGTHPPCLLSASSFASASRMSACRKDNFTFRRSSSKTTTRYSIYNCHELRGRQKAMLVLPRLPIAEHPSPCLLRAARLREVAASNEFCAVSDGSTTVWHTSIPHCRTRSALFLASGHASGVPTALPKLSPCHACKLLAKAYKSPIFLECWRPVLQSPGRLRRYSLHKKSLGLVVLVMMAPLIDRFHSMPVSYQKFKKAERYSNRS